MDTIKYETLVGAGMGTPTQEKQVPLEHNKLQMCSKCLEELGVSIGALQTRLEPVLLSDSTRIKEETGESKEEPICPMAMNIDDKINKVVVLIRQVQDILSRLQV